MHLGENSSQSVPAETSTAIKDYRESVYENLRDTLAQRNIPKSFGKFAQRVAVFSEPLQDLGCSEMKMKKIVWDRLERMLHPEDFSASRDIQAVKTLFTALFDGADSAAAEFFVNEKKYGNESNIVYCPTRNFSIVSPESTNFYKLSFSGLIGCRWEAKKNRDVEDAERKFMIDQCFHLIFVMNSENDDAALMTNKLFDYAISSHANSIPHLIEVLHSDATDIAAPKHDKDKIIRPDEKTGLTKETSNGGEQYKQLLLF